ncbi:hypothetical protein PDL71_04615 [Lacibacter sp. MH-610]|uniref:dCTP deaminase domain-containing protein n=1 Tax=Lacibacter sp. MH-610 TaxID=3020883 RepID=UPI0038923B28
MAEQSKINSKLGEALKQYQKYRNEDPYPTIQSALLNCDDIIKYIEKVKMVFPFTPDSTNMKPASIALNVKGAIIYFDENGKKKEINLAGPEDTFELKRNTIAFVSLSSSINLPHYIAARFNLQIEYVHRGIILGTGPLVDPGFNGELLIPLHNLTNNDYIIKFNEPIIWMEFTKLSMSSDFASKMGDDHSGNFFPFKKASSNLTPSQYLAKAAKNTPIVSSVSKLVIEAEYLQKKSEATIDRFNWLGILSLATLLIGLGTFLYNTTIMNNENVKDFQKMEIQIDSINKKLDTVMSKISKNKK